MFSYAPANQNAMVWQSLFSIEQKADDNSGSRNDNKEEVKKYSVSKQTFSKETSKKAETVSAVFAEYNLHQQSKSINETLNDSRQRVCISSIEEIRNTKMRI